MKIVFTCLLTACACVLAAPRHVKTPPAKSAPEIPSSTAPLSLTLAAAEEIALRQSPTIQASRFKVLAARQFTRETRSAFYPQITGEVSAVATGDDIADHLGFSRITNKDTRIGATGTLSNPTILSREANGILINQLMTDFGRTWNLTEASKSLALSEEQRSALARAKTLLLVDQSYFRLLQAQAVLRVARETVSARQLFSDQVAALARGQVKSDLDASLAKVSLDEAKLLQLEAQNRLDAAAAELSTALGFSQARQFHLAEVPQFTQPNGQLGSFIMQALTSRPEAIGLRHQRDAANRLTKAERAARMPKVTLFGAAGLTAAGDDRVEGDYAAAGVNVEIPLFTGFRLSARIQEADWNARAADETVQETENLIAKDVEVALLNSRNSFDKIGVTASLLANSEQAYDLAEAKYKLGVTSLVEFSQAQLAKLQAQINNVSAVYEYQIHRLIFDFQIGSPHFLQAAPGQPRD